jgi:hypothetical protein
MLQTISRLENLLHALGDQLAVGDAQLLQITLLSETIQTYYLLSETIQTSAPR